MFGQKRKLRQKRKRCNLASTFQKLEDRTLLAAINFTPAGELFIGGDAGNNTATLTQLNSTTYRAMVDNISRDIPVASVTSIAFLGFHGDDSFTNSTSATVFAYGGAGDDTLRGGNGFDNLVGNSGNDTIYGNGGNDRLVGSNGDDTIFGGDGNDKLFGSAGDNELNGGNGDDFIFGSDTGDDIINGDNGVDWLFGLGGNDRLDSGAGGSSEGAELIAGNAGDDTLIGGDGVNMLYGGDGNDTINGGINADNRMHGQAGDDVIVGGNQADFIRGYAGNDTITGGGGNDTIDAGEGSNDIVKFSKTYADSTIQVPSNGQPAIIVSDGTDQVVRAEWLSFSDRQVATDKSTLAEPEAESLTDLNNYRASLGRPVLTAANDLNAFAENWSRAMSQIGLVHSSTSSRQDLRVDGRSTIGENIAQISDVGQSAAEVAAIMHNAWVNSDQHRNNMLNPNFTEVGIGIFKSGGYWWGTHVFAG